MKRIFHTPPAKELLTRPQSHGGCWRLPDSAAQIRLHRRLKAGSPWPERIHRVLTVGLVLAFLGILAGVWLSVLWCTGSDSKTSQDCFNAALWACGAFTVLILAKCYANSKYPVK